jgi:hypothetical protein
MDISAVSNIQSIQAMYARSKEARSNTLQKALNSSYNMLPIDKFMDITGITLSNILPFELMWNSFQHNIPIYVTDELVRVFGYKGTPSKQKEQVSRLVTKYKIPIIQLSNDEYSNFLYPQQGVQNANPDFDSDVHYPKLDKSNGKGKTLHTLIMPDDLKSLWLITRTDNGDRVREYMVQLDKLFNLYLEYQSMYKTNQLTIKDARIDELIENVKIQTEMLTDMKEDLEELNQKFDISSDERAVRTNDESKHAGFLILRLNNPLFPWAYYAVRAQRRSLNATLKKLRKKHSNMETLIEIPYQPNGINFFNLMREKLLQFVVDGNNMNLNEGYSEAQFVRDVKNLDMSKKDVDLEIPAFD